MATRKRKRCETPSIALPVELLDIIAQYACYNRTEGLGLADNIDFKTTLSLALVSSRIYRLTIPILYTHVRLTKPSDVLLYARTASTFSSLCTHTETLWIGPDEKHVESRHHWPLDGDGNRMRSSITDPAELPIGIDVGTWFGFAAGQVISEEWIFETARNVIRRACRVVGDPRNGRGVSLRRGAATTFDGKELQLDEGHIRVYQVQQRLDAFLRGVRTAQNSFSAPGFASRTSLVTTRELCRQRTVLGYQADVAPQRQSQEQTPTSSLRMHDAFDRFDHPIVYARTGAACRWPDDDWGRIKWEMVLSLEDFEFGLNDTSDESETESSNWHYSKIATYFEDETSQSSEGDVSEQIDDDTSEHYKDHASKLLEDVDVDMPDQYEDDTSNLVEDNASAHLASNTSAYSGADAEEQVEYETSEQGVYEGMQDAVVNRTMLYFCNDYIGDCYLDLEKEICREVESGTPTVGALSLLARIILVRSPNLVCLALTSYLQKVVTGERTGQDFERLNLLALGPPGRRFETPLRLSHGGLSCVKRLRLWDAAPSELVAFTIDSANAWPSLESMHCTWSAPCINPFEETDQTMILRESRTDRAIERLLGCSNIRVVVPRKKPFQLTVMAHRRRVAEFYDQASEALKNHPRLEIKRLPLGLEDGGGREHRSRVRALAHIRQEWEEESKETLSPV